MNVRLGNTATHNALIKVTCSPPRKGMDFIIIKPWTEGAEWTEGDQPMILSAGHPAHQFNHNFTLRGKRHCTLKLLCVYLQWIKLSMSFTDCLLNL